MVRGYIAEKKAGVQRILDTKRHQQEYGQQLAAFQAEVRSRDENLLDDRETALNSAPEYLKPLF